jgi:hypothetical protein
VFGSDEHEPSADDPGQDPDRSPPEAARASDNSHDPGDHRQDRGHKAVQIRATRRLHNALSQDRESRAAFTTYTPMVLTTTTQARVSASVDTKPERLRSPFVSERP